MINGLRKDLKRAVADGKLSLAAYEYIISHPEIESITRAQDKKDHGINGVARQKDVQKLQKEVDEHRKDYWNLVRTLKDQGIETGVTIMPGRPGVVKSTPSGSGEV